MSAFLFNTSVDSHESRHAVAVTLSCVSGDRTLSGLWTKIYLCLVTVLNFHQIIYYTSASVRTCKYSRKWYLGFLAYHEL